MKLVFSHFILLLSLNSCSEISVDCYQTMSVKILSESTISRERTLVYQTLYQNFEVLIQQKKVGEIWTVYNTA